MGSGSPERQEAVIQARADEGKSRGTGEAGRFGMCFRGCADLVLLMAWVWGEAERSQGLREM